MNRLLLLLACVFFASLPVRADGPDEQYVRIYQLIQEADRLNDRGEGRNAAEKYIEARQSLDRFRGLYPGWNDRVVNYRLNYIATKLAPLTQQLSVLVPSAAPTNPPPAATTPAVPPPAVAVQPVSTPPVTPPAAPVVTPPRPADVEQLRALQAEIDLLKSDNRTLAARLKEALSAQPATVDPRELARAEERIRFLLKENELTKAQLAARKAAPVTPPPANSGLAEQTEIIAALRTENEILKKQTAEWREKYAALTTAAEAARTQMATQLAENEAAVRRLTEENSGLQKQVELWRQVSQNTQRQNALAPIPAMPPDAQRELLALRARLQVLEAKPVPYTAEEMALFNRPTPSLVVEMAAPGGAAASKSTPPPAESVPGRVSRGVPPGAGPLLRAAERAFALQQYGEAEKKYAEVLSQDENNVTMLGNLASVQVELGRLGEASKYVKRALTLDPNDYFALYVLGRINYREGKMDEALDALSRSAQANPNYPDTQNYLGIVLSEKGQRAPAEAALRRAVQLQPENAVAHNNLAVVYATQKPPALALARWHYDKARAAGHPRNPELEKMFEQKP